MKKNSFRYREDMPSDEFESVIDADSGEERTDAKRGNLNKTYMGLLEWATKRSGNLFPNKMKQIAAMKRMRIAKIGPEDIKRRWEEMENDPFYKRTGIDFTMVASNFDRKPL